LGARKFANDFNALLAPTPEQTVNVFHAQLGVDTGQNRHYIEPMITYYLEQISVSTFTITGHGDEGITSRDTYFSLEIARMRLTELEEDGNVCIDTLMTGY